MAAQYAQLPYSYISSGIKAPKTGLRKDDGIYGTNEHVIRDVTSNNDLTRPTFEVHENGAFSSSASLEEPGVTVNPLYGVQVQHHPPGGLPRQPKLQPELPHNKHPPTSENQYRQPHQGSEGQMKQDQTYRQDLGLNVYNGAPRNPQSQAIYARPQQSNVDTGNSSAATNGNLQKNMRISSFPPNMENAEFSYDSVPRTLAPMAPVASTAVGSYQMSQHPQSADQKPSVFNNFSLKSEVNSFGVNNSASQPQYGIAAHPLRQQDQIRKEMAGHQAGTSPAVFVANPAAVNQAGKQSDFAFENPDFTLYAGNNVPRESETASPTNVHSSVSYPLQPLKSSVTTTAPPSSNRAKLDRDESSCCGGGGSGTACIIVAIVLTVLVCLGAGFAAGWFGRQAAYGDTSTTSETNNYTSEVEVPKTTTIAQTTRISSATTTTATIITTESTTTTTPTATTTTTTPTTTTTTTASSKTSSDLISSNTTTPSTSLSSSTLPSTSNDALSVRAR